MRLVVAVLKPAQVEAVRQALAAVHVTRLTICDAQGYSGGSEGNTALVQESVMEIAVNEDFLERTVETIHKAIHKEIHEAMHLGETAGGDAGPPQCVKGAPRQTKSPVLALHSRAPSDAARAVRFASVPPT